MKFSWRRWRFGLFVAVITGICTSFAVGVIVPTMTLREGILVFTGMIAKDMLLFLKEHPVDSILLNGDTTSIRKEDIK